MRLELRKLTRAVFLPAPMLLLVGCPGASVSPVDTGSAVLSWNAPTTDTTNAPVSDVSGYRIYVGSDPSDLSVRLDISPESTTCRVSHLGPGTHFFAVAAYNREGREGPRSNLGSKTF